MKKQMSHADQIREDEPITPEIMGAASDTAYKVFKDLKASLHDGCEVVIAIENFTSKKLHLFQKSAHHNNGNFKVAPDKYIDSKEIGFVGSNGGTGPGNKNYALYDFEGGELLIYWHSARMGGKTYFMDFRKGHHYQDMGDPGKTGDDRKKDRDDAILDYCKDHQTEYDLTKTPENLEYTVESSFGAEEITVSIKTRKQAKE